MEKPRLYWADIGPECKEEHETNPCESAYAQVVRWEDVKQLLEDAARYRWLCDGHGYFMEEEGLCGHGNEKAAADEAIDRARESANRKVRP